MHLLILNGPLIEVSPVTLLLKKKDSNTYHCTNLAVKFVVEESEPFVNIAHDPCVGVDVEAVDEMLEGGGRF